MKLDAIEHCVQQLAERYGLQVDRVLLNRDEDSFVLTMCRRSFKASKIVHMPTYPTAAVIFEVINDAIDDVDAYLRAEELRAVFDYDESRAMGLGRIPDEEARRIGNQLLRVFMHLVRGDQFLRKRVAEVALALGANDVVTALIEQKQRRAEVIAKMDAADAEQLALDLMGRVERLRSGAS